MSEAKKPHANTEQQMLAARVDWEIQQMIFQHLKRKADHGYPFATPDEMKDKYVSDQLESVLKIKNGLIFWGI